jgi:hypothetical protein
VLRYGANKWMPGSPAPPGLLEKSTICVRIIFANTTEMIWFALWCTDLLTVVSGADREDDRHVMANTTVMTF